jgi:hypothetical protein
VMGLVITWWEKSNVSEHRATRRAHYSTGQTKETITKP